MEDEKLLTDNVSGIIDAIWPDGHIARPRWNDEELMSVLADALEEAGCADEKVLAALRVGDKYTQDAHWARMPLISRLREILRELRIRRESAELTKATVSIVTDLEERSRDAYAQRQVSLGYRLKAKALLLKKHPGYIRVESHDLRGTPPPGTIWIRWSSGGRYGKSRREKFGRKLTVQELLGGKP